MKEDLSKIDKYDITCFYLNTSGDINYKYLKNKYRLFQCPHHRGNDSNIYVGNSIWPIVEFYKRYPNFDKYIIQEYDTNFVGDYSTLFEKIPFENYDCIFQEKPVICSSSWYWDQYSDMCIKKYHCLLQWYCIDRKLLDYFEKMYILNNYKGHYECLLPSIIIDGNFRIGYLNDYFDIIMDYSKSDFYNKFAKYITAKNALKDVFLHPIKI